MGNRKNKKAWRTPKKLFEPYRKRVLNFCVKELFHEEWFAEKEPRISENKNLVEMDEAPLEFDVIEEEVDNVLTASEKKLQAFPHVDFEEELDNVDQMESTDNQMDKQPEGSRILDICLLANALAKAAKCSSCNSIGLSMEEKFNSQEGWASEMYKNARQKQPSLRHNTWEIAKTTLQ